MAANKEKENTLEHQVLLELLEYFPEEGLFRWKVSRGPRARGAVAGNLQTNGYSQVRINNKLYLVHRLAWFYTHKVWPTHNIDHIDRNPSNNKLSNLREATQSQNLQNTRILSTNTSGVRGVSFNKSRNKFEAYISIANKKQNLGLFNTLEEASNAYSTAAGALRGTYINEDK